MSEKLIVEKIRSYLKSVGAKVEKQHGSIYGRNGVPDLLGCFQGRAIALEVKQPGKHLTPLQAKELSEWSEAGAITGKVESVDDVRWLLFSNGCFGS